MMHFGALGIETPQGDLRLSGQNWLQLETALVLDLAGFAADARRYVVGLEANLQREANLREAAAKARSARKAQMAVRGARRTRLPDAERGIADPQIKRFDKLKRKLSITTLKDDQRDMTARELAYIERAPRITAEESALKVRMVEMAVLEQIRDPDTTFTRAASGVVHIKRVTSLDSLFASGAINEAERAAGEKYREMVMTAAVVPALKVADWGATGGGDPDHVGQGLEAILLAQKAAKELTRVHKLIEARVSHKRALWALKMVAGEGRKVSHIAKGAGRARTVEALKLALTVLVGMWRLA